MSGTVFARGKAWIRTKVVEPVKSWLKEGAEPAILSRSTAVGFGLGLCPLLGVSTLLCLGAMFVAKLLQTRMPILALHPAMTLLSNLLSVPVEVAMVLPYMRVGEWLLGAPKLEVVHIRLKDLWEGNLAADLFLGLLHAILGWLVTLPLVVFLIIVTTRPLFGFMKSRLDRLHLYEEVELGWKEYEGGDDEEGTGGFAPRGPIRQNEELIAEGPSEVMPLLPR